MRKRYSAWIVLKSTECFISRDPLAAVLECLYPKKSPKKLPRFSFQLFHAILQSLSKKCFYRLPERLLFKIGAIVQRHLEKVVWGLFVYHQLLLGNLVLRDRHDCANIHSGSQKFSTLQFVHYGFMMVPVVISLSHATIPLQFHYDFATIKFLMFTV